VILFIVVKENAIVYTYQRL